MQALRLKICDSHLTCKVANKCLNVRERVEVVEWNKKVVPSLPLLSYESSVSVKENPDRKKNKKKNQFDFLYIKRCVEKKKLLIPRNKVVK